MAKISVQRFDRTLLSGLDAAVAKAFAGVLDRVEAQLRDIIVALTGRLTFGENMLCEVRDIAFLAPTVPALPTLPTWTNGEPKLSTKLPNVIGVWPIFCHQRGVQQNQSGGAPALEFELGVGGTIRIKSITGLVAGAQYDMRLLIISG